METPRVTVVRPPTAGYTCPLCGEPMANRPSHRVVWPVDGEGITKQHAASR